MLVRNGPHEAEKDAMWHHSTNWKGQWCYSPVREASFPVIISTPVVMVAPNKQSGTSSFSCL
ncbi:hypothetical protein INR49_016946 [Caranx melampygus]|nr:hypothetical protein INR49_016946 [Caranx melampygus]